MYSTSQTSTRVNEAKSAGGRHKGKWLTGETQSNSQWGTSQPKSMGKCERESAAHIFGNTGDETYRSKSAAEGAVFPATLRAHDASASHDIVRGGLERTK